MKSQMTLEKTRIGIEIATLLVPFFQMNIGGQRKKKELSSYPALETFFRRKKIWIWVHLYQLPLKILKLPKLLLMTLR